MDRESRFTEQMRKMLPQWMKMAKDPSSIGAQFLNVFGLEFEDVEYYLDFTLSNQYIDTANIGQIDIVYRLPLALPVITDLEEIDTVIGYRLDQEYGTYTFRIVDQLRDFYLADEDQDVAILDREKGILYFRPQKFLIDKDRFKPLDYIEVNTAKHYEYYLHHIWNAFDEFGLLLGLERLYGERNAEFKERILDVFRNPGNSTKQGLINAISRDLGISQDQVKINELSNPAFRGSLLREDGSPSERLLSYVDRINKLLGFTWDHMSWGEAYWRSIEEKNLGLEYLPHVWDASMEPWKSEDFQSGVGDGDDLLVIPPKPESNTRSFTCYVGLRGTKPEVQMQHPEIEFQYKIEAEGTIYSEEYRPEVYKYTVVASEILYLHFIIKAYKQYLYTTVVDFNVNQKPYKTDPDGGAEIVTGTTYLSIPTDPYVKVKVEMETKDKKATPKLQSLTVKWKDTNGQVHNFVIDTESQWTQNNASVDVEMADMNVTTDGTLELGFGDFYYKIDNYNAWYESVIENIGKQEKTGDHNIEFLSEGSIQLKLPNL